MLVDEASEENMVQAEAGEIFDVVVTPSLNQTYVAETFNFEFKPQDPIEAGGHVQINLPRELTLLETA